MKRKMKALREWVSRKGSFEVDVQGGVLDLALVSDGVSVRFQWHGQEFLLASGRGQIDVSVVLPSPGLLVFKADTKDTATSVCLGAWVGEPRDAGWVDGDAFTQLELKDRNSVSPEVQALFERMNANAARREALLMQQIQRLSGQ